MEIALDRFLHISFPESENADLHDITTKIETGSCTLSETIFTSGNISFGRYSSNMYEVTIYDLPDVSEQKIQVYLTDSSGLRTDVFTGYVDSCKLDNLGHYRHIVAYDELYWKRNLSVSMWWETFWTNRLSTTLKVMRESLCDFVGFTYDSTINYFNDSLVIKQKSPEIDSINFAQMLTYICELQCLFPNISRNGSIEFISLNPTESASHNIRGLYEQVSSEFEDYTTYAISQIAITLDNDVVCRTTSSSKSIYTIDNNILLYDYTNEELTDFAIAYLAEAGTITYVPASIKFICSDFSIKLGDILVTDRGVVRVFTNNFSGSLFVEQTVKCTGDKSLSEVTTNYNVTYANLSKRVAETNRELHEDYISAKVINAEFVTTARLEADYIDADTINANFIKTTELEADYITADAIAAKYMSTDELTAKYIDAETIEADYVKTDTLEANYITANDINAGYAKINLADIDIANIDQAFVNYLQGNYANLSLANVENAFINHGVFNTASIVDEQVLSVSANKITLAQLDASKIRVTNLNADNITTGKLTVGGLTIDVTNSKAALNGNSIVDGTITLSGFSQEVLDRLDGLIETWTGNTVPTLFNYPAMDWTTTTARQSHVGDVYYCGRQVDAALVGVAIAGVAVVGNEDIEGRSYRFSYDNTTNTFEWIQIKDNDVTKALAEIDEIKAFDVEVSRFIDETDEGINDLIIKTTSLEGVTNTLTGDMALKLDKSVFNTVAHTADENLAEIISYTDLTQVWYNDDGTTTTLTGVGNIVNRLKQTEDSFSSDISSLTKTVKSSTRNYMRMLDGDINPVTATKCTFTYDVNTGTYVLKRSSSSSTAFTQITATNNFRMPSALRGQNVVFHADSIVSSRTSNDARVYLLIHDVSSSIAGVAKAGKAVVNGTTVRSVYLDKNNFTRTLVMPDTDCTMQLIIRMDQNKTDTVNNTLTVKGIKLEIGELTTDWMPAVEDTTETIESKYSRLYQDLDGFRLEVGDTYQTISDMGQYSTTVQMNSAIQQSADAINLSVSEAISDTNGQISSTRTDINALSNQLVLKVNDNGRLAKVKLGTSPGNTSNVTIQAEDINLVGKVTITALASEVKEQMVISSVSTNYYGLSTSTSTAPTTWVTTPNSLTWSSGKYVWIKTRTTYFYQNGNSDYTDSTAVYDKQLTTALSTANTANNTANTAKNTADTANTNVANLKTTAIKATISLYYRSTSSSTPSKPNESTTISSSDDTNNVWTTKLPKPKKQSNDTATYFFTCEQYTFNDNTKSWSSVTQLSNLTSSTLWCSANDSTYIDGGHIYASSVTSDQLAANSVDANKIVSTSIPIDKLTTDAQNTLAADEQYIYKSIASGAVIGNAPTTWVTTASDSQNTWTTKRPTYNTSYPVLYVAKQKKSASGKVTSTSPVRDDTTTVIDGGHITTGTIDAKRINISQLISQGNIAVSSDLPTKVSELTNDSGYQTSSQVSTAITNGISGKADSSAAVTEEQIIYISKASGTDSVNGTTTWITRTTNSQNTWTLKRPTYNSSYPVLFIAKQRKTVSGTITCSTPLKDDTTTVIDGGHITTGSIDASRITTGTMSANRINGGILKLGGASNGNGTLEVYNASGTKIGSWDNTGAIITGNVTLDNAGIKTFNGIGGTYWYYQIEGLVWQKAFNVFAIEHRNTSNVLTTKRTFTSYDTDASECTVSSTQRSSRVIVANTGSVSDSSAPTKGTWFHEMVGSLAGSSDPELYMRDIGKVNESSGHLDSYYTERFTETGYYLNGSSPSIRLRVANDIYIKSTAHSFSISNTATIDNKTIQFTSSSSKRYKKDIKNLSDEQLNPQKLLSLPVKQFVYNDDAILQYEDMRGKTIPGFIAEDIEKIYPSAVIHNENGVIESWDERRLIPAMLSLIQNQQKQIQELEMRIKALENGVK